MVQRPAEVGAAQNVVHRTHDPIVRPHQRQDRFLPHAGQRIIDGFSRIVDLRADGDALADHGAGCGAEIEVLERNVRETLRRFDGIGRRGEDPQHPVLHRGDGGHTRSVRVFGGSAPRAIRFSAMLDRSIARNVSHLRRRARRRAAG